MRTFHTKRIPLTKYRTLNRMADLSKLLDLRNKVFLSACKEDPSLLP